MNQSAKAEADRLYERLCRVQPFREFQAEVRNFREFARIAKLTPAERDNYINGAKVSRSFDKVSKGLLRSGGAR